jgi:hypothetical protein
LSFRRGVLQFFARFFHRKAVRLQLDPRHVASVCQTHAVVKVLLGPAQVFLRHKAFALHEALVLQESARFVLLQRQFRSLEVREALDLEGAAAVARNLLLDQISL